MYLRKAYVSLYIYIRIVLFKNWFYFVQSRFVDFPIYVERFTIQKQSRDQEYWRGTIEARQDERNSRQVKKG